MATERFTQQEFEQALPEGKWKSLGMVQGEQVYQVLIDGKRYAVNIRSSIGSSGFADGAGEDSIRFAVVDAKNGRYLGKDSSAYVTRVVGWQQRVAAMLEKLADRCYRAGYCPVCGNPYELNMSNTEKNPNRWFAKCKTDDKFNWLDKGRPGPRLYGTTVETTVETALPTPPVNALGGFLAKGQSAALTSDEAQTHDDEADALNKPVVYTPKPVIKRTPNDEQRAAIEAPLTGAVRVLAGPGAGKTFSISLRYAYMIDHGIEPDRIVAVTFGKDMATELFERIVSVKPELKGTAAEQYICTIHALCFRLLKDDGLRANVAKTWEQKKIAQEAIDRLWEHSEDKPGWEEVMGWLNSAKMQGLIEDEDFDYFIGGCGKYHGPRLHDARQLIDQGLRAQRLITFPDMLYAVDRLLQDSIPVRLKWQAKFTHMIIDEGQDTSGQAMRILNALIFKTGNLFIVGDPDQLLYRFTGATPEANLFEGFEQRYPYGTTVKLVTNYRSTQAIVQDQMRLIAHNYSALGGPYRQDLMKQLKPRPDAPQGQPATFEMHLTIEDEAEALAENIVEQLANGREPGDIFVGSRTRAQLGFLEGPLMTAKVPFINITGGSFWSQGHIADVIAHLRVAHNTRDKEAFKRIYNKASNWFTCPFGEHKGEYITHRYLGAAFYEACGGTFEGIWNAARQRRAFQAGVDDINSVIGGLQAELAEADHCGQLVQWVLDNQFVKWLKHEEGLTNEDASENGKLDDLATVVQIAATFPVLADFLKFVADAVEAAERAKDKDWGRYVVLSTVHRLKGKERKVVYGVGWCESEDGLLGMTPHTFSLVEPPQNGVLPSGGMSRMEDERCGAFVLVSRAQEEVHLSGFRQHKKKAWKASRFYWELRGQHLITTEQDAIAHDIAALVNQGGQLSADGKTVEMMVEDYDLEDIDDEDDDAQD